MIEIFTKYAWAKPLADEKAKTALDGFVEIIDKSKRKPNKICVDLGKMFYKKPMQKWLDDNDILMYSTYNEGESVVVERFTRTLKGINCNKMTPRNSLSVHN